MSIRELKKGVDVSRMQKEFVSLEILKQDGFSFSEESNATLDYPSVKYPAFLAFQSPEWII